MITMLIISGILNLLIDSKKLKIQELFQC